MSNPTTQQSRLIPVALSNDGGVSYKNVTCKKLFDLTGDKPLVEDDSDCGHHVAVGASTKFTLGFEFIFNTSINGATEISSNQIMSYFTAGTLINFKLQYPTSGSPGSTYSRKGAGYITNYVESAPLNGFVTGKGTLIMDGAIDTTAP